jgi:hypothetical protein
MMEESCIRRGRVRVERYRPPHDTVSKRYRVARPPCSSAIASILVTKSESIFEFQPMETQVC